MIRVLSVFGTRPEAIKMAPVVQALQNAPDRFESVVCVSAQHRAMLDQVLDVFGLDVDHDLDLMVAGQSPAGITARVLERGFRFVTMQTLAERLGAVAPRQ